ncbi:MAG: radical SAM protein [Candidatus Dormibacteraeota bacterium]|nr:radical SAM protein [Candidatus Dormibacteraeota bacterium]
MEELEPRRAPVVFDESPCRSALNRVQGMPFNWSLNPYMGCEHRCTFCYVRAFEKRADRASGDGYGRTVRVKTNVAEVLDQELSRRSWHGEQVAIGAATDPYQPAEGRYRLTRACLGVLARHRNPASLITRGPMVVRDVDVLTDLARRGGVSVSFSVPTLDHEVWRRTEPGTAPPEQRLRAMRRLTEAGIRAGVSMAPILPGLSDRPDQLARVVAGAREAGASFLWVNLLYLREGTREHFLGALARDWPDLLPRYEALYRGRAYLPEPATRPVTHQVGELRRHLGGWEPPRPVIEPVPREPEPEQLTLLAS